MPFVGPYPTGAPARDPAVSDERLQAESERILARSRIVGIACGLMVLLGALAALAAWATGHVPWVRWSPDWPAMSPWSAVTLLVVALAVVLPRWMSEVWCRRTRLTAGAVVALVALAHLAGSALVPGHAFARLLFGEALGAAGETGWMSAASATAYLALAISLVALPEHRVRWAQAAALFAALLGVVGVTTYFSGSAHLALVPAYDTMSLPSALGICLIAIAELVIFADRGVLALVTGADAGAYLARQLLPYALLGPFVLRALELYSEQLGMPAPTARMLTLLAYVVGGTLLALRLARLLGRADRDRRQVERELRHAEGVLREQEERTRIALELTGVGTFEYDALTGRQVLSDHARSLFGLGPQDDVSPPSIVAAMHPDDRPLALKAQASLDPHGAGRFAFEHRVVRPDGSTRWIETRGHTLFAGDDGRRRPERSVGTMRDVTAERELGDRVREAEERARLALDAASLGTYDLDPRTGAVVWDARARELLGLGRLESPAWRVFLDAVRPEAREEFAAAVAAALTADGAGVLDADCPLVSARIVHVTGRTTFADGVAVRMVGTMEDVTEEREAESKFRAFADSVPAICWIMDAAGQVSYVNEPWSVYLAMGGREAMTRWGEMIHPEELDEFRERWARSFATGEPFEMEHRLRRADGELRWFVTRARAQRAPDGRVMRWFGASMDIHAARVSAQALGRSEQAFRVFIDSIPSPAWTMRADGVTDYVNRPWREYFGIGSEAGSWQEWVRFIHPDDVPRTVARWERSLETGVEYENEYRLRDAHGHYRWFLARVRAQRDEAGAVVRWFGTATDIDAVKSLEQTLRESEAHLREADRRKDEFLATLAHELRNPLAPIRQASQLASMPEASPAQVQWGHGVIDRQVAGMSRLLDDLLDVSRITRGRLELRREWVSVAQLVESALETARPLIEARRHRLTLELPARELRVEVDPLRMAQVIGNLLTNAAKYTEPGGEVHLVATQVDGALEVRVRDTGLGLEPAMLARVFEMFAQAQPALERTEGGLGIGLALVRGIVELHGGTVEGHSEGLGRGCEFVVRVPTQGREVDVPVPDFEPPREPRAKRRVLVADDNVDGAESLAELLRVWGHDVLVAHDGTAALALAEEVRPEILLLDIGMPGLNGYEVAAEIRQRSWGTEVMLVAVTGWGHQEDRRRSLAAGFEVHLTKPVEPQSLRALLGRRVAS